MFQKYDEGTLKTVVNMALPSIAESFFVSFAGLVDAYMVSSLGANAVASVGLTTQPKMIGLAVFTAINVSISALVARRFGEKKRSEANSILMTALWMIVTLAVVISCAFVAFAPRIISMCGSTPETHDGAVAYFSIIMGGMIFNCIQMGINAAQRGAGNTRITMRTNITSNLINVLFNYLLIQGHIGFPALGIRGAALASVLGTVVSSIMSLLSILKQESFVSLTYIIQEKIKPSLASLKNIIKVGYSVFLEQLLMRVGFLSTAVMAANQGSAAMAAHQVCMNILSLSFSFGDGLQVAAVALNGRSLGEGKPEKAKEFGRACLLLGSIISVCVAVTYFFGARRAMQLFFAEEEIIQIGTIIMRIVILVVLFQIRQMIYTGCLRGAGDTRFTAFTSMLSVAVMRSVVGYICAYPLGMGLAGIWLGIVSDHVTRYILNGLRFRSGKWTTIKI